MPLRAFSLATLANVATLACSNFSRAGDQRRMACPVLSEPWVTRSFRPKPTAPSSNAGLTTSLRRLPTTRPALFMRSARCRARSSPSLAHARLAGRSGDGHMPGPAMRSCGTGSAKKRSVVMTSTVVGDRRRHLKRRCKAPSAKTPASMASTRSKSQDVGANANVTQDSSDSTLRHAGAHCTTLGWRTLLVDVASQPGMRGLSRRAGSRPRLRRDHTAANGSGP